MTNSTALLKGQPADIWDTILEYANNPAASAVSRAFNKCQNQLIGRLWGRFRFDQYPNIRAWFTQNTIFGDRPLTIANKTVIQGKHIGQLHRLLTAGTQTTKSIRPEFYADLAQQANDRNLMKIFPKIREAFSLVRSSLPREIPTNPDQIRGWIKRALLVLNFRFPNGTPFVFDFSNLGLTVIPKEFVHFKAFMGTVNLSGNRLSIIPRGLFSNCPQLGTLALDRNILRSLPADLASNCPHLWYLSVKKNRVEELPLDFLSSAPLLERLSLEANRLLQLPPNFLSNSAKLRFLSLRDNQLTGLSLGFGRNWSWLQKRGNEIWKGNPMEPYTLIDRVERGITFYEDIPFWRKVVYTGSFLTSALVAPWYATAVVGLVQLGLELKAQSVSDEVAALL
ncbi:MAG TPA: hypothetical protein VLG44_08590 [Chlamydiales bacterium]|nr:hypothetical protein [Chlamydiales bacterium]